MNTIGAMNGFRVPKHMKGPPDTHWKIKDKDGWILDYNGERSAVVHRGPVPLGWRAPHRPARCTRLHALAREEALFPRGGPKKDTYFPGATGP